MKGTESFMMAAFMGVASPEAGSAGPTACPMALCFALGVESEWPCTAVLTKDQWTVSWLET